MKPEDCVAGVKEEIVEGGLSVYKEAYANPRVLTEAVSLFNRLSAEEKEIFFRILRGVLVDTVAGLFALLDGTFLLMKQNDDFKLVCLDNPNEQINGDLMDIFLSNEPKMGGRQR